MKVNRDLLLRVKEKILAEPAQFEMELLFRDQEQFDNREKWRSESRTVPLDVYREVPNCGTAACIAGWAVSLYLDANPAEATTKWQGLRLSLETVFGFEKECEHHDEAEDDQPCFCESKRFKSLCYVDGWPGEQQKAWFMSMDLPSRARIAAEVIDLRLAEWAAEDEKQEEADAR